MSDKIKKKVSRESDYGNGSGEERESVKQFGDRHGHTRTSADSTSYSGLVFYKMGSDGAYWCHLDSTIPSTMKVVGEMIDYRCSLC